MLTIGLPRAMLYYRYRELWKTYFDCLGVQTVISEPTTRATLERGAALSVDETCLSARVWFGHVDSLIGRCDALFVPRVASLGPRQTMCTRFMGLPDLTRQVFRHSGVKVYDCNVDVNDRHSEQDAYIQLGADMGFTVKQARQAWHEAVRADEKAWRQRVTENEKLYRAEGIRVILAAHSYVYEDAWIGRPVVDFLRGMGVTVIPADVVDRKQALRRSAQLSSTLRWQMSR